MAYPPGGPGQQPWPGQMPGAAPGTAGLAVASLVLGLLAVLGLCGSSVLSLAGFGIALAIIVAGVLAVVLGAAAVFTGIGAHRQIRTGAATGKGLATTGLVLGIVSITLVVVALVLLIVLVLLDT